MRVRVSQVRHYATHIPSRSGRFLRGYAMPIAHARRSADWDAARRDAVSRRAHSLVERYESSCGSLSVSRCWIDEPHALVVLYIVNRVESLSTDSPIAWPFTACSEVVQRVWLQSPAGGKFDSSKEYWRAHGGILEPCGGVRKYRVASTYSCTGGALTGRSEVVSRSNSARPGISGLRFNIAQASL
jgi:hypothetical protein